MHTIDWVSADSDKASLCWLGGKDNRMVICTLFIFEIKGLWYASPWEQALQNDHRTVSNLWFWFTNSYDIFPLGGKGKKKKKGLILRPETNQESDAQGIQGCSSAENIMTPERIP